LTSEVPLVSTLLRSSWPSLPGHRWMVFGSGHSGPLLHATPTTGFSERYKKQMRCIPEHVIPKSTPTTMSGCHLACIARAMLGVVLADRFSTSRDCVYRSRGDRDVQSVYALTPATVW